jgi:rod shape-determining protein MreC
MPAKVVGNTVTLQSNYLTLERGAQQGVKKDMAVISPEGIAGVVVSVSDSYSKVMSLLHRNSKVSVMLKKDNIAGSIEWDGVDPAFLVLKNIPKSAVVKTGDTVLTSTYSAKFPSHLMVGRIAAIVPDKSSNFYILKVKTATNFYNIQNAYIIENMRFAEQNSLENMLEKNQ